MAASNIATDPRLAIRAFAAGLGTAISLTVKYVAPDIPDELLIAWVGVFTLGVGVGEVIFDHRS